MISETHYSVAFVTGNRGPGLAFLQEVQARRVQTVYGGVRNPDTVQLDGVVPVKVDVTDPSSVQAVAERSGDVTLLINLAGIGVVTAGAPDPKFIDSARQMFDINFHGIVGASAAFGPPSPTTLVARS